MLACGKSCVTVMVIRALCSASRRAASCRQHTGVDRTVLVALTSRSLEQGGQFCLQVARLFTSCALHALY